MRKKLLSKIVLRIVALWCAGLYAVAGNPEPQPNIIFILADDQRYDELGCAGDPILQTPHIDRLANQGVRFRNAFVTTPICMASRASIFTGLTQRTHQWAPGSPDSKPLNDAKLDICFPLLLRQAGYSTGYYGKNHVVFESGTDKAFNRMFDDWEMIGRNPYFKKMPDGSARHCDEIMGDRSVAFLGQQSADQPFFLYMSFNIAHAEDSDLRPGIGQYPWPKEVDGLYENTSIPRPRLDDPKIFDALPEFLKTSLNRDRWFWRWDTPEKYSINMRARYRMITGMDRIIGRVLDVLERQGLAENTVVIYSADNGYYRGERGFAGKWSHFEESLHVPLLVFDPRQPVGQRGTVVDPMALNIDLPSTILNLAGVDVPEVYQGQSLLPVYRGETPESRRAEFFCEHHQFGNMIPAWSGVRSERYVYACYDHLNPPYEFLHDLQRDPDELENLVNDPESAGILNEMRGLRQSHIQEYTQAGIELSRPNEPVRLSPEIKRYQGGEVTFSGKDCLKVGSSSKLGVEDSYTWSFQVRIDSGNAPGAVLLGNRETPGMSGLNFVKITADRGAQLYGGDGKSCRLNAVLPKEKWIDVQLRKIGRSVTLSVDHQVVASGEIDFSLPAMPCYLGGDPQVENEFATCSIRKADIGAVVSGVK